MDSGIAPEHTNAYVTLSVTPGLKVPNERLSTEPCASRIAKLANKESPEGLIDLGGMAQLDCPVLAEGHHHGFISAVCAAFAYHYPLALRPQHLWCLILQAVANHLDLHAENVRQRWVAHEGKKELLVRRDSFVLGQANEWSGVVDGPADSLSAQVDANLLEGVAADISPGWSSPTPAETLCEKITVMDVCKQFFSYKMSTYCGFPSVTLEGTADDWELLRRHAERLISQRCEHEWAQRWMDSLLPLLDKIQHEYSLGAAMQGTPRASQVQKSTMVVGDATFWNSMCKRGGTGGSGARSWFNGWFNILFPDLLGKPNQFCVPYAPTNAYATEDRNQGLYPGGLGGGPGPPAGVQGPDCADFPSGLATAPLTWQYYTRAIPLSCQAGFVGAAQHSADGTVTPVLAWFICHACTERSVLDLHLEPKSRVDDPAWRELCLTALAKVPLLAPLRSDPRCFPRLVDALAQVTYAPSTPILIEGEAGSNHLYIVLEGAAVVTKADREEELARRAEGDCFGDMALLRPSVVPNIASITACEGSGCTVARISGDQFRRLFPLA